MSKVRLNIYHFSLSVSLPLLLFIIALAKSVICFLFIFFSAAINAKYIPEEFHSTMGSLKKSNHLLKGVCFYGIRWADQMRLLNNWYYSTNLFWLRHGITKENKPVSHIELLFDFDDSVYFIRGPFCIQGRVLGIWPRDWIHVMKLCDAYRGRNSPTILNWLWSISDTKNGDFVYSISKQNID